MVSFIGDGADEHGLAGVLEEGEEVDGIAALADVGDRGDNFIGTEGFSGVGRVAGVSNFTSGGQFSTTTLTSVS